ncbi:MAG: isoaspartyl peptidase/L-asparaginase [Bacteroidetes bacterium]|jgi:beta-aspartyl-peptidase (threonine type)|nr:isoaspartyl peptidase/L-asparaginase [Bacteroidota bacterium]
MRNTLYLLVAVLIIGLQSCETTPEIITPPAYALVIHGGAGVIKAEYMTAEMDSSYRVSLAEALDAGKNILENGGTSLDAVSVVISILEDNPLFNAGRGAVFNEQGFIEHDASIMLGSDRNAGAVGAVRNIKNPILAARLVMEESKHVFLVREGAEQFAALKGLQIVDPSWFMVNKQRKKYEQTKSTQPEREFPLGEKHGTVGAVALDNFGNLAAGTSTGGMHFKQPGRLGDTPVIGAGTYADNESCAVSATGHGEFFIRYAVAHDLVARMKYGGQSLEEAAEQVVMQELVNSDAGGGIIAIDKVGNICMKFNTPGMFRASVKAGEEPYIGLYADPKTAKKE